MNVEELCGKPVKFRDWIFFTLVMAFFVSWAYLLGVGEGASELSSLVAPAFLLATLGYCLYCYYSYQAYIKRAKLHYDHFLAQMSKKELKRLLNDDRLSSLSKTLLKAHYQLRFEKSELRA